MKQTTFFVMALSIIIVISCKEKDDPTVGFSEEVQKIVPKRIIDDARSKGMIINEGRIPPNIEGNYVVEPLELLSPYGSKDSWKKGKIINAYYYSFYDQSSDGKTVFIDYSNLDSDNGSGLGSFISGNGKKFTIFSETYGTASGVDYVMLKILSGELTVNKEIKNFQESLYMKEKDEGNDDGVLIPINTGRIWFDNDKISERTSTYYGKLRKASGDDKKSSLVGTGK
ncbi:hypothetical protein [Emticicia fluvialis]|uniref:hypothetical protein n=1 Tax=Emticicia fluvialis TaxID=2974474 RepID=UPI002166348E|nr:hypothetical protein [Emticicia fluvialis]